MLIKEKSFKIIVKANSKKNKILGFDEEKQAYRIEIKAPAEKGKANLEIIKFLSRELGFKVRIMSGLTSREKIIQWKFL